MTYFKVCCIQSVQEAELAIDAGAKAIGLVGAMPSGPGPIEDHEIKSIAATIGKRHGDKIWTVLLTSRTDGADIADHVAATGVNTVQLVDTPDAGAYETLRKMTPGLRIIQVIHVETDRAIAAARKAANSVDVVLLDSGKPFAEVRTLGGTGDVHDWRISREIVSSVSAPVFLAGGLNPANAAEAIARVSPYGLDICSGLRDKENGYRLNPEKLSAFARSIRL